MRKPTTQALARLRKAYTLTHAQSAQALAAAVQAESERDANRRAAEDRLAEMCDFYTSFNQRSMLDPAIAVSASIAIGGHAAEAASAGTAHTQAQEQLLSQREQFSHVTATKHAIEKLDLQRRRDTAKRIEERALLHLELRAGTP